MAGAQANGARQAQNCGTESTADGTAGYCKFVARLVVERSPDGHFGINSTSSDSRVRS